MKSFIAVNWGSSNFRAYLIGSDGVILNQMSCDKGVTKIDRKQMVSLVDDMVTEFDANDLPIYAAGMIGSPVGWQGVGYCDCPSSPNIMANRLTKVSIGTHNVYLVPGLTYTNSTGHPDVMRGEEMELLGLLSGFPHLHRGAHILALPGTHTKWVRVEDGEITSFFTSMAGELFDRLKEKSLLSSVMTASSKLGSAFDKGLEDGGRLGSGLCRGLFNVRAQVVTGHLEPDDSESYARGLLIAGEMLDAMSIYPEIMKQDRVLLLGNPNLCKLYERALARKSLHGEIVDPNRISVEGFLRLHSSNIERLAA